MGSKAGGTFDEFWEKARRAGGYYTEVKAAAVKLDGKVFETNVPAPQAATGLTLLAVPHIFFYDGRGANKPWLQEIPEPVTQLVWDSWVEIHPDTARSLGVVAKRNRRVAFRGWRDLGARDGFRARASGRARGADRSGPYRLRTLCERQGRQCVVGAAAMGHGGRGQGASDRRRAPASLAAFGDSQMGRGIVQTISIDDLAKGVLPPSDEPKPPQPYEMYAPFDYPVHKWGMTIDVNACTGCSACVAACYAENNLHVVGKDQVEIGRIMSWIRVERYFPPKEKANEAPLMQVAPMLCQQCDHAPCEPVCPVFASVHTKEGLNQQIYNRCVGTRYCDNNCPYKVRRFNWSLPEWDEPLNLQLNPDVTVRGAGVMEKCTFCIQRITYAELNALIEKRPVRDGEIQPACVQACPSKAITFGDEDDPQSAMMRRRIDNKLRRYLVLEEINAGPNVTYLRDIYQTRGKA